MGYIFWNWVIHFEHVVDCEYDLNLGCVGIDRVIFFRLTCNCIGKFVIKAFGLVCASMINFEHFMYINDAIKY